MEFPFSCQPAVWGPDLMGEWQTPTEASHFAPALSEMPIFPEWMMEKAETSIFPPPTVELPRVVLAPEVMQGAQEVSASPSTAQKLARFPPGLSPPAGTPSHGSILHGSGHCRPCAWFWKLGGCLNAEDCAHCHLCPEGEIKARKKAKQTMMQLGLATPQPRGHSNVPAMGFSMDCKELRVTAVKSEPAANIVSDEGSTTGSATIPSSELDGASCTGQEDNFSGNEAPVVAHLESSDVDSDDRSQDASRLPNVGSALHGTGKCRPCAWYHKSTACQKNQDCNFCHLCPESALKARKKSKLAAARRETAMVNSDAKFEHHPHSALSLASLL